MDSLIEDCAEESLVDASGYEKEKRAGIKQRRRGTRMAYLPVIPTRLRSKKEVTPNMQAMVSEQNAK